MYRITDYGWMLRDGARIEAYTRALASVITPESVVLDLGAGIGTFSLLAARLGAARVYAVDPSETIAVAEEHARENGLAERIRFIHARATELELPEQVDVIVSDLASALPLFEESLTSILSARDRFLRAGGALIPQRDRLLCAPVSDAELYASIVGPWRSVDGVSLSAGERLALNAAHARVVDPARIAAEPRAWAELDYATLQSPDVHAALQWELGAPAVVHAIALWFESTLRDGITISSGPWNPNSVHSTMVLPLAEPLHADALRLRIDAVLVDGQYRVTWSAYSPDATFVIADAALMRRVGDDAVVLHEGEYHVLNETGARVWELLAAGDDADAIAAAVAVDYDVETERAAAGVRAIIEELLQAKLIRPSGRTSPAPR